MIPCAIYVQVAVRLIYIRRQYCVQHKKTPRNDEAFYEYYLKGKVLDRDAMFIHPVAHGHSGDAQQPGGFGNIIAGLFQGI